MYVFKGIRLVGVWKCLPVPKLQTVFPQPCCSGDKGLRLMNLSNTRPAPGNENKNIAVVTKRTRARATCRALR